MLLQFYFTKSKSIIITPCFSPWLQVVEARNRGLPVYFGDVSRPEVLRSFNIEKARTVIVTTNEMSATNKAVVTLRKLYPELPIFARAVDMSHKKRLQKTLDVNAMVPILPEDSILLSLPFGGRVLRYMGLSTEEIAVLMEETRSKALTETFGLDDEEEGEILEQLGVLATATNGEGIKLPSKLTPPGDKKDLE